MLVDPDICLKKKRTNLAKLQSLSSYLLRKMREKIFPSSLLSPFKNVMLLLFLLRILCVKILQSNSIATSCKISLMSSVYICMTTNTQTL